jgi:hypothetical protein
MTNTAGLRPLERRIRRLVDEQMPEADIARRFRRSPDFIRRVVEWSGLPNRAAVPSAAGQLRPIERRILRWREDGAEPAEIALRFGRGLDYVQQVEDLARYKLAR